MTHFVFVTALLFFTAIAVKLVASRERSRRPNGSCEKYAATSISIVANIALSICFLIFATIAGLDERFFVTGLSLLIALLYFIGAKRAWHDDNWFHSQYKRLKR